MKTMKLERSGRLAIVRIDKGHGNAIDGALVEDLSRLLDELSSDGKVDGVLLASAHPKIFCPGLDLRELARLDRPAMTAFLDRFNATVRKLFSFAKPVVAAIDGHAAAGGCVLALCADHRVLREEGVFIGLNEVKLGVALPWSVTVIVRSAVPAHRLAEAVMLGRNTKGREALDFGMAHELAPAGQVEATALARLEEFASKDGQAVAIIKKYLRTEAVESMRAGDAARSHEFIDVWFSPATQARIRDTVQALETR